MWRSWGTCSEDRRTGIRCKFELTITDGQRRLGHRGRATSDIRYVGIQYLSRHFPLLIRSDPIPLPPPSYTFTHSSVGEGEVARAQETKTGMGEEEDMTSDLDRKKKEQEGAREEIKAQRKEGVDVAGVLGQSGAPVVPAT